MSGDPRYQTYAWRKLRKWIRARDFNMCKVNLPGCTKVATCVDHIVEPGPPHHGRNDLFYDANNCRASCASCNTAKRNRHRSELARQAEALVKPSREW